MTLRRFAVFTRGTTRLRTSPVRLSTREHRGLFGVVDHVSLVVAGDLVAVLVRRVSADPCLVGNDDTRHERTGNVADHRFAEPVCHKPRRARSQPYLRSISLAAIPFLFAHISNMTNSQMRSDTLEPCITVPVVTENCLRQSRHFQKRRGVTEPVRVLRPSVALGVRK